MYGHYAQRISGGRAAYAGVVFFHHFKESVKTSRLAGREIVDLVHKGLHIQCLVPESLRVRIPQFPEQYLAQILQGVVSGRYVHIEFRCQEAGHRVFRIVYAAQQGHQPVHNRRGLQFQGIVGDDGYALAYEALRNQAAAAVVPDKHRYVPVCEAGLQRFVYHSDHTLQFLILAAEFDGYQAFVPLFRRNGLTHIGIYG